MLLFQREVVKRGAIFGVVPPCKRLSITLPLAELTTYYVRDTEAQRNAERGFANEGERILLWHCKKGRQIYACLP